MISTRHEIQNQLNALLQEARSLQREQHLLITTRRNAARFGQIERELDTRIWPAVDALRNQLNGGGR